MSRIAVNFQVMATTQQDIESRLSYAYLHAVMSHAGFICRPAIPDEDKEGIDAVVTAYGSFPGAWRTQITINVQLKATVGVPADDGTHLSYFVQGIRRYDKLRRRSSRAGCGFLLCYFCHRNTLTG